MRDESNKLKLFSRRTFFLGSIKLALFSLLFMRYYYLQIVDSLKYKTLSDKNRIKLSIIPPIRGQVTDRTDHSIINNRLTYRISLDSQNFDEIRRIIDKLNSFLTKKVTLSDDEIRYRLKKLIRNSYFLLFDDLGWEDIAKIELNNHELPGVIIDQGQRRHYALYSKTSHITGYIGTPNAKDLENLSIPNFNDFYIGKNGIEKTLDDTLRGYPGIKKTEVDALGNFIREIANDPPKEGSTIKLSLDHKIQTFIADSFGEEAGTVVLLNIKTGEVLALYSSPTFNPNLFIGGISFKDWETINANPYNPLINKAISTPYPPGSTFKIVTALAALEHQIPPGFKVFCNGEHKVGNRIFHCWNPKGHGNVDIELAIAQSCNVYFYTVAEKLGIKNIAQTAKLLGLGNKTRIELPFENKGNIPEPKWKFLRFSQNWTLGDTINASIGQGFVLATPLQLATMVAKIASGKNLKPSLLYQKTLPKFNNLEFDQKSLELIRTGMFMVFNDHRGNGFSNRLNLPDFQICGKTGTAQVISQRKTDKKHLTDHGLFVGFAPYHDPTYAISVVVEHGSWGAISALPIAKKIFHHLYLHNI